MTQGNIAMRWVFACLLITIAEHVDAESTWEGPDLRLNIAEMASGLEEPWGLALLPGGAFLITERGGRLLYFAGPGAVPRSVSGVPDVHARGQGGLLDVMVPRDFENSRQVFLTYAAPRDGGAATVLGAGRLSADGTRLEGVREIYAADPMPGGRHFGARVVEGAGGDLWLVTGDRGAGDPAQDPLRAEGKVIRLDRDGTPVQAIRGARPGVFSIGHRNIQGAAVDAEGQLWTVEHGARGGDEINAPQAGRNYGWPVISHGTDYDGSRIGEGTSKPGMEQPEHYWDPSIAPSGMAILSGTAIPEWRGSILVGSLKFDAIYRLDPARGFAEEIIRTPDTLRVRDLREAADGAIWFLSVGQGAAYRMTP